MIHSVASQNIIEEMQINSAMKNRTIYLKGTVEEDVIFKLNYYLNRLRRLDKENGTKEDITLVIGSFGGSIYQGLASVSLMEYMIETEGYNIITIVDTIAMSMGSSILQIGSTRKAYRYSTILYHQPSSFTDGKLGDMENDVNETKRLWELMKKITIKHTFFTDEKLEEIKKTKTDYYMTPEEALKLGVIDEIL